MEGGGFSYTNFKCQSACTGITVLLDGLTWRRFTCERHKSLAKLMKLLNTKKYSASVTLIIILRIQDYVSIWTNCIPVIR